MVSLPRIQNDRLMFFLLFPIRQCKTIRWCWRFSLKYYVLSPNPKQAVGVGFLAHNMVSHPGTLSEALVLVLVLRTWFSIRESKTSRWYWRSLLNRWLVMFHPWIRNEPLELALFLRIWYPNWESKTSHRCPNRKSKPSRWCWRSCLEHDVPTENTNQAVGAGGLVWIIVLH